MSVQVSRGYLGEDGKMLQLKQGLMALGVSFLVVQPSLAQEEEELAPGYNACIADSGYSDFAMLDCVSSAYSYWDKVLNQNYKLAMQGCQDSEDPAKCRQILRQAERHFVAYKEGITDYLMLAAGGSAMGSLDRVSINYTLVLLTRQQAKVLAQYTGQN